MEVRESWMSLPATSLPHGCTGVSRVFRESFAQGNSLTSHRPCGSRASVAVHSEYAVQLHSLVELGVADAVPAEIALAHRVMNMMSKPIGLSSGSGVPRRGAFSVIFMRHQPLLPIAYTYRYSIHICYITQELSYLSSFICVHKYK